MKAETLPGLQAHYWFVPGGDTVDLRLSLGFDPALAGEPADVRRIWIAFRDRLAAGGTGPAKPVRLVTSLSAEGMEATADGVALAERIAGFAASVLAALDGDGGSVSAVELGFGLSRPGATAFADFTRLIVILNLCEGVPDPEAKDPVPDALSVEPRFGDGELAPFAIAFAKAWQGFDGGEGTLRLALEFGAGRLLWCAKVSRTCGIALSPSAKKASGFVAAPPLSRRRLSGTVADVDGEGAEERFEGIDPEDWWDIFAAELDGLAQAQEDGAKLPDKVLHRLHRMRESVCTALADRLVPVARADGSGVDEARAFFEEELGRALGDLPVICSGAVEVRRGAPVPGEPAPWLRGRVETGATTPESAHAGAALRLEAGERQLLIALPRARESRQDQAFPARFDCVWIRREEVPGLWLLAVQGPDDPLAVEIDPKAPPPLIALPHPPAIAGAAAVASPGAPDLDEALLWQVRIEIPALPAVQDRLEFAIGPGTLPAPGAAPCRAGGALFEALARLVRFTNATPAPEEDPDPKALDRFLDLAEAVARALPDWEPPVAEVPDMPAGWRYAVDFADLPALIVTREAAVAPGNGGSAPPPPWPLLAGFVTPAAEDGAVARYEPQPEAPAAAELRITVPGLRLLTHRTARVHARIRRNGGLAETVDPAFVCYSDIASSEALSPQLDWEAPEPQPAEPSLASALGGLLDAIGEGAVGRYGLGFAAELVRRLSAEGDEPIETRVPLALLPPVRIGGDGGCALDEVKKGFAAALAGARAMLEPEGRDFEIASEVTLHGDEGGGAHLARLRVRLPVPESDPGWWTREEARTV